MYIVGFNGPPRSGKDTLAKMLAEHLDSKTNLPVRVLSLSMPMRRMVFGLIGMTYTDDAYETMKDKKHAVLGCTIRQFMIDISEQFMKPNYGGQVWAQLLFARGKDTAPEVILIPDIGFQEEAGYLENAAGHSNFAMVQVHRDGCDFSNDSRNWVRTAGWPMTVLNDGDLDELRTEAVRIYGRMVNQWQWKL